MMFKGGFILNRLSLLIIVSISLFLVACGSNDNGNEFDEEAFDEEFGDELEELYEDNNEENMEEEKLEVDAEVTDINYYDWIDEAVDEETITVYAEVKNTNDVAISVESADVTYLDSDGGVIAVNDATVSPKFLNSGSVGYVSAEIEDDIDRFEDLNDVEIEVSPEAFDETDVVELTTKDDDLKIETWGNETSKISVTGYFENDSDVNLSEEDTNAIIGLYDEDDNFLAAEGMYVDQKFSIEANDETSFEIGGGSPLPPELKEKVDHAEVKAIGIENMDDYSW